jgi:ribosomal protein L7/L12
MKGRMMGVNLTPEEREAISAELVSGRKIEAIKLYREATGLGLAEAKEAIEHFDHQWDLSQPASRDLPAASATLSPEQVEAISDALANRDTIKAIKIYRDATGKGLKESKGFIDALIPQLKQQDPERFAHAGEGLSFDCGPKVLMVLILGGLILGAVIVLT